MIVRLGSYFAQGYRAGIGWGERACADTFAETERAWFQQYWPEAKFEDDGAEPDPFEAP